MTRQSLTKQVIAFVAAAVVVFTVVDIGILWRNQYAARVFDLGNRHLIYQASGMALGVDTAGSTDISLLRYTPDGGWVIESAGRWISSPTVHHYADMTLIVNHSAGAGNAWWLCAVRRSAQLTAVQLYRPGDPTHSETYTFHHGGIIEPVLLAPGTVVRGLVGHQVVFTVHPAN